MLWILRRTREYSVSYHVLVGFNISLSVEMDGPFLERWLAFWEDNLSQSEMQSEAWELRLGWSSLRV